MARYIDVDPILKDMCSHRQHSVPFEYLQSLTPARVVPAPQWISVKERLPDESGDYLTFRKSGICAVLGYSAKYHAFNSCDNLPKSALKYRIKVTHWMPLPQPPEEDET